MKQLERFQNFAPANHFLFQIRQSEWERSGYSTINRVPDAVTAFLVRPDSAESEVNIAHKRFIIEAYDDMTQGPDYENSSVLPFIHSLFNIS
jgi:hypothetical protein